MKLTMGLLCSDTFNISLPLPRQQPDFFNCWLLLYRETGLILTDIQTLFKEGVLMMLLLLMMMMTNLNLTMSSVLPPLLNFPSRNNYFHYSVTLSLSRTPPCLIVGPRERNRVLKESVTFRHKTVRTRTPPFTQKILFQSNFTAKESRYMYNYSPNQKSVCETGRERRETMRQ